MPIYEWKRPLGTCYCNGDTEFCECPPDWEYTTTQGSIHDPVPVPEGGGWGRMYNYQVGKVSGVGDSPSRSVKSQ